MLIKNLGELKPLPLEIPEIGDVSPLLGVQAIMSDVQTISNGYGNTGQAEWLDYTVFNPDIPNLSGHFLEAPVCSNVYPAYSSVGTPNSRGYYGVVIYGYEGYYSGGGTYWIEGFNRYPDIVTTKSTFEWTPTIGVEDLTGQKIKLGAYGYLTRISPTEPLPMPTSFDENFEKVDSPSGYAQLDVDEMEEHDYFTVTPGSYEYITGLSGKLKTTDYMTLTYKYTQFVEDLQIVKVEGVNGLLPQGWETENPNSVPYYVKTSERNGKTYYDYYEFSNFTGKNFAKYKVDLPSTTTQEVEPTGAASKWVYYSPTFAIGCEVWIQALVNQHQATFITLGDDGVETSNAGNAYGAKTGVYFSFLTENGMYISDAGNLVQYIDKSGYWYYFKSSGGQFAFLNYAAQKTSMMSLGHYPFVGGTLGERMLSRGNVEGIFPTTTPEYFEEAVELENIDMSQIGGVRIGGEFCLAWYFNYGEDEDYDPDEDGDYDDDDYDDDDDDDDDEDYEPQSLTLLLILRDGSGYFTCEVPNVDNVEAVGFDGTNIIMEVTEYLPPNYEPSTRYVGLQLSAKLPAFQYSVSLGDMSLCLMPCYNACLGHNSQIAKV